MSCNRRYGALVIDTVPPAGTLCNRLALAAWLAFSHTTISSVPTDWWKLFNYLISNIQK